jgi:hypothetical protein
MYYPPVLGLEGSLYIVLFPLELHIWKCVFERYMCHLEVNNRCHHSISFGEIASVVYYIV